jgi:hypothetical protein
MLHPGRQGKAICDLDSLHQELEFLQIMFLQKGYILQAIHTSNGVTLRWFFNPSQHHLQLHQEDADQAHQQHNTSPINSFQCPSAHKEQGGPKTMGVNSISCEHETVHTQQTGCSTEIRVKEQQQHTQHTHTQKYTDIYPFPSAILHK